MGKKQQLEQDIKGLEAMAGQFMEKAAAEGHVAPGWRIRVARADGTRCWRTMDSIGMPDETDLEAEALCFSRREHAEAFAQDDADDVEVAFTGSGLEVAEAGMKAIVDSLDFEPDEQHQVPDMANVGKALMDAIARHRPDYCWNNSPAEIVCDLINEAYDAQRWFPIETAPKDGTLLLLLVDYQMGEHALENELVARTIGFNNLDNDGEDEWKFAGWCWAHDHFVQGMGTPTHYARLLPAPKGNSNG